MVSIHTPALGTTKVTLGIPGMAKAFQSTPPMQGATTEDQDGQMTLRVSIHAPYAGSDTDARRREKFSQRFQSTPPMQGATMTGIYNAYGQGMFQSTPPMQGAT